jgi:hypothetical protein
MGHCVRVADGYTIIECLWTRLHSLLKCPTTLDSKYYRYKQFYIYEISYFNSVDDHFLLFYGKDKVLFLVFLR